MSDFIEPGKTIGILGGGQLGRMMALAAREMGYKIAVLDPTKNSPCGQISDIEIVAPFDDIEAAKKLSEVSDVITYEFENIDAHVAEYLEKNANLPQGFQLLAITQDREFEKKEVQSLGIKVAPFEIIYTEKEFEQALETIGMPSVLKTCRGGYDGKGQVVIRNTEDIGKAKELIGQQKLILEQWVPFEKEISVIVVRNKNGEVSTFPVAENIHKDNILHETIVPARISEKTEEKARKIAFTIAKDLSLVGTLAVEMFVTSDGDIFVNEMAPRPHNSGHYTIDACKNSQFDQHIRAICNWPLGKTTLLTPVVMVNILGEHLEKAVQHIPFYDDSKLHLYGKKEAKEKRKMGHLNILAPSTEEALKKVDTLKIW